MPPSDGEGFPVDLDSCFTRDGIPFSIAHCSPDGVGTHGLGFSHWNEDLFFATSDSTNPNINRTSIQFRRGLLTLSDETQHGRDVLSLQLYFAMSFFPNLHHPRPARVIPLPRNRLAISSGVNLSSTQPEAALLIWMARSRIARMRTQGNLSASQWPTGCMPRSSRQRRRRVLRIGRHDWKALNIASMMTLGMPSFAAVCSRTVKIAMRTPISSLNPTS